ncbi:FAD-dependent pyridine nucleotide-disulfide oxidoreductase [Desulfobulbus propionicus DSM 2032]|uniref:FAD-dependent pyridine nucleotide-disulfide oxidoreductase n=1 Tax=Desulfobulbus propionicus (strain ATCC 33891 / DSM 2032 / VKM B-1956 / 1pr3) TaxID=577650 RepID=A0A7U3YLD8_DESPD|nr:FAD-dependent oxidoreductase [Desulfobulbus propionicus]ADW17523.1 FAD-dependent pyridine nucleotide-disulfide oxidoreductase [Desulfobulbus propionicus DSM 2032]
MRFVIIGGDAAGMSAASRARRNDPGMEIIVLEQGRDVSYSACNIPYNIADPRREMEDLVVRSARAFREKQGIDLRTGHRVEHIDRAGKTVAGRTAGGEPFTVAYDRLLIATGADPIKPPIEGMDLSGVFVVKNLEHGRRIKTFLRDRQAKRAVIVGMGYIALEMAEALSERGLAVDLIKPRAGLLPWLDPALSQPVRELLVARGVGVHDGYPIERIIAEGEQLRVIAGELRLEADVVIAAIGVTPNASLAREAGLDVSVGGSIAVDRGLRTSDSAIYAAGDCADSYHIVTGEKTWIPLALRANRAGWAVADNVCGQQVELPGVAGTAVFKVFAMQVARTGLNEAEARGAGFDPVRVQIRSKSRAGIYPGAQPVYVSMVGDRASGRLLGAQMTGIDQVAHRINAVAVALLAGMGVAEFSQSDLAYAPPFGPTWDPLLTAANQLVKQLKG